MSLGVIPVVLIIIGLVIVAGVTSLIAYIITASRRGTASGAVPSATDQQLADLEHPHDDAEIADTDHATNRTHPRSQS